MKKIIGLLIINLFLFTGCASKTEVKVEQSKGREEALRLKKEAEKVWQVERWKEKDPKVVDPDDL